jgi:glutamyl-tRNA synthetase
MAQAMELKFRDFLFPLFIATSGRAVSLPLFDSWMFLGADLSRSRLRSALELIGASKKERKRLDKEYQAIKAAIDSAPAPT